MPASLLLTSVHLRVSQLQQSIAFYAGQLGFVVVHESAHRAELAVARNQPALLTLIEDRAAGPAPRHAAGLFHAALLLPSRAALGGWLRQADARRVEFDGFSDHGVSEALYLTDPDGNGLEIYCDRPRAEWPIANGELAMTTRALDLRSLLADATPERPEPLTGAHWGHLHLRVTSLERSEAFYRTNLGLAVTQGSYPGARFMAADGYHHHLGLNTWGTPRLPQPAHSLGLIEASFAGAGTTVESTLTDPDGIHLRVSPFPAAVKNP